MTEEIAIDISPHLITIQLDYELQIKRIEGGKYDGMFTGAIGDKVEFRLVKSLARPDGIYEDKGELIADAEKLLYTMLNHRLGNPTLA